MVEQVVVVDTLKQAREVCAQLLRCDAVTLDLEGFDLGRPHGEIHLVVMSTRAGVVYCFDAHVIGPDLFGALRPLLVSGAVLKLCYDCRCDAAALLLHHGAELRPVCDLQIAFTRLYQSPRDQYLKGLHVALRAPDVVADRAALDLAVSCKSKFKGAMQRGERDIFAQRPLSPDVLAYCAVDVLHLFPMFDKWSAMVPPAELVRASAERIRAFHARDPAQTMARVDFPRPLFQRAYHHLSAAPKREMLAVVDTRAGKRVAVAF